MKVKSVTYTGSFHREDICPKDKLPEFAFIGRSNVGKSSLINMLLDKKDLARVSKQPGKTQSLNYYLVNESWYLVDLPGYGYAKSAQSMRENWRKMILYYLKNRATLVVAFVLLDGRHTLQKIDKEFMEWCAENGVPFSIIFTKADKVKKDELAQNLASIQKDLLEDWEKLPDQFVSSAETGLGQEDILNFIAHLMEKV
ncbi:MAG: YihA family ribosome biogenesis GTP-binding protein [Saprospiraceae bacterium]|nr:YihA family ribosome biogenesis GTP-binding protein [Saprospiraceae bacterium]